MQEHKSALEAKVARLEKENAEAIAQKEPKQEPRSPDRQEEMKQLQEVWNLIYRSDHVIAEGLKQARGQELLPAAEHLCRFLEASIGVGRRGPMPALGGR